MAIVQQISEASTLCFGLGRAGTQQQTIEELGVGARGFGKGTEGVQAKRSTRVTTHHGAQRLWKMIKQEGESEHMVSAQSLTKK